MKATIPINNVSPAIFKDDRFVSVSSIDKEYSLIVYEGYIINSRLEVSLVSNPEDPTVLIELPPDCIDGPQRIRVLKESLSYEQRTSRP
jgi:hypothetical protein